MFDHVGNAVSDLTASERFYRTVLAVLGAQPSYAGADMVGWEDWWIGPTDREHPVTRDPQASRRFYTTIAPHAGLRLAHDAPDRVRFCGPDFSFSLVHDERPLTEHVHLALGVRARQSRTPRRAG